MTEGGKMADRLTVHFESLTEASEELESIAGALQGHLSELDDAVRQVMESWTGGARDEFHLQYKQWSAASKGLHRSLRTLQKTVHTAHGNYSAARSANLRMWGGR
ncbi:WXG100 family type VII secretion target [Streptomyces lydicus]|uniref:WXG100 family type VII secretion target n=1 Tax=Streptomyces lydicus TaxID=47763 RepID=UPI0039A71A22